MFGSVAIARDCTDWLGQLQGTALIGWVSCQRLLPLVGSVGRDCSDWVDQLAGTAGIGWDLSGTALIGEDNYQRLL